MKRDDRGPGADLETTPAWSLTGLRRRFRARRHSALLAAIVAAFAARPLLGDVGAASVAFAAALLLLLLLALYNIQVDELVGERKALLSERRWRRAIGWAMALVALAERIVVFVAPTPGRVRLGSIAWLAFLVFVTWTELRTVLRQREVTGETISMCVSVYLLIGLCFGLLYAVLFQLDPQSFSLGNPPAAHLDGLDSLRPFAVFVYFSLTMLATFGYGEIAPLTLQARYLTVAEGIVGQFYLAILVARLVGMQMSQPGARSSDA